MPWQVDLAVDGLSQLWSLPPERIDEMLLANLYRLAGIVNPGLKLPQ